ncbi:acyl-CoA dehydrogenase [Halioxenophilus sp. WMMB6]|uniref:acyl-CoA dehydrogenase n=1 Tax=Halioxenophilus sp. WMMB6 TaxID=3073815 RepID=UPI00295EA2EA|nr:acyl-CoA dehydrogenase [Halioxenophilus sp. WMMB6]
MSIPLLNERDIDFLLYEFLNAEALLSRPRYQEHSRETFNATLNTAKGIAEKYFANHAALGDANEPQFVNGEVQLIPETKAAWQACAEAGFLAAHCSFEEGGMQLPEVVLRAATAYFSAANVATAAYPMLTTGAANLIASFGSDEQKACFLAPMRDGRFAGTMALTEPAQGSALADITTSAEAAADGSYRITGQKIFISGGDQPITENIVHMVLARIKGAPAGVKGISLFIVPKFLVNADGSLAARNDVALAGLLHKMGYRNTTSTVLSFGEQGGAVGYLVGEPHQGLAYMFQMMNEARISVGTGAAILAYQGFNCALDYARNRPQGRHPSNKDSASKQVLIVEHADVKRMLLAQKAYAEGGLALCMYGSSLFEDSRTAESESAREEAFLLLDLLTPIVKSWPSKYGLKANELAIQVYGGAGYIREYPVERLYRDQRLNPIHEGTEGIQAIDLLGRKVPMRKLAGFSLFLKAVAATVAAATDQPDLADLAGSLARACDRLHDVTAALLPRLAEDPDRGLANASLYLDVFGRVTMSWIWLQQALAAQQGLVAAGVSESDSNFYLGKIQAARYYIEWELPEIEPQIGLLQAGNCTPFAMQDAWF